MIPREELQGYLQELLVETASGNEFVAVQRDRAINEAVLLLGDRFPEEFAHIAELTYSEQTHTYPLTDNDDALLAVLGLVDLYGNVRGLKPYTIAQAVDADACWQYSTDPARGYVYDKPTDPYRIRIFGQFDTAHKLRVIVSRVSNLAIDNEEELIPLHRRFIPMIVDAALKRLLGTETVSTGLSNYHAQLFEQGAAMHLAAAAARGPQAGSQ